MGWAARTKHNGPGMHDTRRQRFPRLWGQRDVASALNNEFGIGQRRDKRQKGDLLHVPSESGTGRWHSLRTLRASKAKAKRLREMAAEARALNRAA